MVVDRVVALTLVGVGSSIVTLQSSIFETDLSGDDDDDLKESEFDILAVRYHSPGNDGLCQVLAQLESRRVEFDILTVRYHSSGRSGHCQALARFR